MPVNHAKKFLKFVHTVAFFWWLLSETLNFDFSLGKHFSEIFFSEKSFQMVSTISGLMGPEIRHKWNYSTTYSLLRILELFWLKHKGSLHCIILCYKYLIFWGRGGHPSDQLWNDALMKMSWERNIFYGNISYSWACKMTWW